MGITYPPKERIVKPTKTELLYALRFVKKLKVNHWNPWPDEISNNTIRYLRKYDFLDTFKCFSGVQMAQTAYGFNHIEDIITEKGLKLLKQLNKRPKKAVEPV